MAPQSRGIGARRLTPSEDVPWATRRDLEDELDFATLDEVVAQRVGYGVSLRSMYGALANSEAETDDAL